MSKLVIEFENKGKTYLVTQKSVTKYELFVDNVKQEGMTPYEILKKIGWLLHDDSVSVPVMKELEV